ncbi:mannose/fructose/sorbose PTS transporter subunit IIA [Corynebacterium freiburgense]|uniref:mannose/fructose/sorbose PTS transporter subunit IIA n=1 Tax=Corynebacterium freiburgense TaxID=556548 RepID=UPI00040BDEC9|nr:mannose/fructose/sorbose PTS transporter subunit IIA [Corynebacterium freiburgense]WJZ03663.1 PTS system mannose-specific EIIAB component [Corynebacterium freiburgense]
MVCIIIAAHGKCAPALIDSAEMIAGKLENVHAVTFLPGQGPEDLLEEYGNIVGESTDDLLLLVDLFGGSPFNAGARFVADRDRADVVSGVNIPMLIEVFTAARRPNVTLDKLVGKALKAGATGTRALKAGKPPKPPGHKPPADQSMAESANQSSQSQGQDDQQPESEAVIDPNFPRDPNATMDIALLRIDSRLIHGQVAGSWVNHVAPKTLIAACDAAANDELRKSLLLQVGPASARTNVLDIAKTIRVYFNPEYKGMRTMIVVESPMDALRLLEAGVTVDEVNVGGVTFKPGMTLISEAVSVNDEHIAAYKAIHELGVPLVLQQVPTSSRTNMMTKLKEKGLLS